MFFHSLFQKDATPLLRAMGQFTAARHRMLVNDIANVDTPYYQAKKLNLQDFQANLRRAVVNRDAAHPRHFTLRSDRQVRVSGGSGHIETGLTPRPHRFFDHVHSRGTMLESISTRQVKEGVRGNLSFKPRPGQNDGIYKYDHTSNSIERTMSDLAKNTMMGKTFSALLNKKYTMLNSAISERV